MIERCLIAAADISVIDVINTTSVSEAVSTMDNLSTSRMIVTDASGKVLYDSTGDLHLGDYALFPEILQALENNNVFSWNYSYKNNMMYSRAASPIISYGVISGAVYLIENDIAQGTLIGTLQKNVLSITLLLEVAVIVFSAFFARSFYKRINRIHRSMQIIRGGDYSHRLAMGGQDELTLLGDEFNALTERLEASERKRHQFVSDASHELKTPLASIKLLSDSILQNDMDTETVKEFVGDIGNEADRLNRMSTKLLSLAHIESQVDGDCEIVEIAPTIDRVIKMLSVIAEKNSVTIAQNLMGNCPILILEDDLYQIAFNLVENGIKYNRPGGTLHVNVYREDDNAILQVRDTGVGIPEESIPHLFERFYRVDKARARKSGGSGLGLSIVRNMVERNGGSIAVSSTLGEGSVFTVSFPIFDVEEDTQ
jgi:signal transduction histidine kinase